MDGEGKRWGRGLCALRQSYELTQEQLATRAGKVPSYVSRFEAGAYDNPSYNTMEDFARAFGLKDASALVRKLRQASGGLAVADQPLAASG